MIDGKSVEAKRAVPRDEQTSLNKGNKSIQSSTEPANAKKIFVGGLAASVTEAEFEEYFAKFGTVTDIVVMHDHRTQRPRGFGFVTYDSEEAVDKVLQSTVEVKLAVPKEMSRDFKNPMNGNGLGSSRTSPLLNQYVRGYNKSESPVIDYGVSFSPFSHGFGIKLNFDAKPNQNHVLSCNGGMGQPFNPSYSTTHGRNSGS